MHRTPSILKITATLDDLESMRRFVEDQARGFGVESSKIYDLLMAVEELVMNIIVHGYRNGAGSIEIAIRQKENSLEVRLRDQAPLFDPTQAPAPDTTLPLERRAPGGLGIHMARHFTDAMIYKALPEGGNELILIKHLVKQAD